MGSRACSASTKAAMPPVFCASAITCKATVVLPLDSGPKISTTRPRGNPPTPSAESNEMEPVEITAMGTIASLLPSRMMEPFPNCFSICDNARSIARVFSALSSAMNLSLQVPQERVLNAQIITIHDRRKKGELKNHKKLPGWVSPGGAKVRGRTLPVLEAYVVQPGRIGGVI